VNLTLLYNDLRAVIPAKAGIQTPSLRKQGSILLWIPPCQARGRLNQVRNDKICKDSRDFPVSAKMRLLGRGGFSLPLRRRPAFAEAATRRQAKVAPTRSALCFKVLDTRNVSSDHVDGCSFEGGHDPLSLSQRKIFHGMVGHIGNQGKSTIKLNFLVKP
jgi:hypothetical protein